MMRLNQKHLRIVVRRFWGTLFTIVIAFAAILQIGREAFPLLDDYRDVVAEELGKQLGVNVDIKQISAEWKGLRPKLHLHFLRVSNHDNVEIFRVDDAFAELSILDSMVQRRLSWRRIVFSNFSSTFEQRDNGSWKIQGYEGGTALNQNQFAFDDPLDIFLFGRRVDIQEAQLKFNFTNGQSSQLQIPSIKLENDQYFHRLVAHLGLDTDDQALRLVVEGYGDPRDRKNFSASGYIKLHRFPLGKLAQALTGKNVLDDESDTEEKQLEENNAVDLELWFKGAPRTGMTLSGKLALDGASDQKIHEIELPANLSTDISGAWRENGEWFVNLQGLSLLWGGQQLPINLVSLYGKEKQFGLRVSRIDVDQWVQLVLKMGLDKHPRAYKVLDELKPTGVLKNVDVSFTDKRSGYFLLKANVQNGNTEVYRGTPKFSNVNGYLEASAKGGFFQLHTDKDFAVFPTKVFNQAIRADQVRGRVSWKILYDRHEADLQAQLLTGSIGKSKLHGYLAMTLPFARKYGEPQMDLALYTSEMDSDAGLAYLPKKMHKSLNQWLHRSIKGGTFRDVGLFYHGSVEKDPAIHPFVELYAKANELNLDFDPHWPELKHAEGELFVHDADFKATVAKGELLGNAVKDVDIRIASSSASSQRELKISGAIEGRAAAAKKLLLDSPLNKSLGPVLNNWDLDGEIASRVELSIPLDFDEDKIDYRVATHLSGLNVHTRDIGLDLANIAGAFTYSKAKLLQAKQLNFDLFGKPFSASIDSSVKDQQFTVHFSGSVEENKFKAWIRRPELGFVDGDFAVGGDLSVPIREGLHDYSMDMKVRSDLAGVAIHLPEPFAKTADETLPFVAEVKVVPDGSEYRFNFDDRASVQVIDYKGLNRQVQVTLGDSSNATLSSVLGDVSVVGGLKDANLEAWNEARKSYLQYLKQMGGDDTPLITIAQMNLTRVYFGDFALENVKVNAKGDADNWVFDLQSQDLKGKVTVPVNSDTISVDLGYLNIDTEDEKSPPEEQSASEKLAQAPSVFKDWDLNDLIPVNAHIAKFVLDGEDYGEWSFDMLPQGDILHFDNVRGELRHMRVGGKAVNTTFDWNHGAEPQCHFVGPIHIENIGQSLVEWKQEKILDAKSGKFDVDLHWDGYPDQLELNKLIGSVDLDIKNGNFIRGAEAGENPLLRLIALFNFDTMARRLRLDFSDLAAKGFAFDRVRGNLDFQRGMVNLKKPILVQSSSSKMQLAGTVDLVDEKIDSELVVTLPVTGNLAVATAFVAGLPAALGVYVVGKMFSKQVDKVSSINYSITGAWEDPKIKVEKIFDDTAAVKKGESIGETDESYDDSSAGNGSAE